MNRKILQIQIIVLFSFLLMVSVAGAVDVAPRITDREIIEKLTTLEVGQKALRSEMKSGQEALDKRITDLRSEMKSGREAIDKRFAFMEKLMIALIGLIVSLIAFILWDRMATIRPFETRIKKVLLSAPFFS